MERVERFSHDGIRWIVTEPYGPAVRGRSWRDLLEASEPMLWSRKHRKIIRVRLNHLDCVVKQFTRKRFGRWPLDFLYGLKYRFVRSPAEREWESALRIRRLGIPTPIPIAVGTFRVGGELQFSLIVTELLEDSETLETFMKKRMGRLGTASRRGFLARLGRFYRRLHDHNVFQRDFGWRNVLVQSKRPDDERFFLIDFEEVLLERRVPAAIRVRAFAQLNRNLRQVLSRTDRLRLFLAYAGRAARLTEPDRRFLREVEGYPWPPPGRRAR